MKTKLTQRWQTICTVGYTGSVSRAENRAAHGAVTHCEVRRTRDGRTLGRRINSNGRHQEVGESFPLDDEQLARWESIEKSSR
jgi:hypothetical protein